MSFEAIALRPTEILLPAPSVPRETWACVACDQFTSEPTYWADASRLVGDAPSALRLILPECDLKDSAQRVPAIHAAMASYLANGLLETAIPQGFVLCERTTPSGTRAGLVGAIDLEEYSFDRDAQPLVRPTEQTITSRLPPRLAIRRGASVELTHIMLLIDDPEKTILEPLRAKKEVLRKLYDFELMLSGGHLAGYAVESEEDLALVDRGMNTLRTAGGDHPMLLAVGDGNHSLATAKAYWEELRPTLSPEEQAAHPARYALCEIVNLHDPALLFEPIHRLLTGVDAAELLTSWKQYAGDRGMTLSDAPTPGDHVFTLISPQGEQTVAIAHPEGAIPCETAQKFLDDYLAAHPEADIDFIHGDASLRSLATQPGHVGLLLPEIDKLSFFDDVRRLGVLPRKTFSMGEANEKRYYMEARRIG